MTRTRRSALCARSAGAAGTALLLAGSVTLVVAPASAGTSAVPARVSGARAPSGAQHSAPASARGIDPVLRTKTGPVSVMLELDRAPAATAYAAKARTSGHRAAVAAFRAQSGSVERQQRSVERALRRAATPPAAAWAGRTRRRGAVKLCGDVRGGRRAPRSSR